MIQSVSTAEDKTEYLRRLSGKPYFESTLGTHLHLFGNHPASGCAFYLLPGSAVLELRGGDAGPGYAGTADLYYAPAGYIKQDYLGVWRMEDDCLYLKLSADSGDEIDASFPILISPSGEDLYFQRSRTGAGIPFLPDGTDSVGLLLYTG